MEKVHFFLERAAERDALKIAVITKNGHFSYKFLNDLSDCLAKELIQEYGVRPGDRITLLIPDKAFFLIAYYAILKAEATVIPIDHLLTNNEINYILNHSESRFLLTENSISIVNLLEEFQYSKRNKIRLTTNEHDQPFSYYSLLSIRDSEPFSHTYANRFEQDAAVITYTSGTTGVPKGVIITHESILNKMNSLNEVLKVSSKDRILSELSFVYIYGQIMVMNLSVWCGSTAILLDSKDTMELITSLENEQITIMLSIPTTYTSMNEYLSVNKMKLKSGLRYAVTGGSLISTRNKKEIEQNLGVKLLDSYGLTETTASVIMENPEGERKSGSIGKALMGCTVQLWDEYKMELSPGQIGEIVVKTTGMMGGYFKDNYIQSTSFTDGWFHTGDLGYQDINGYFYIVDRRRDIIKTSGFVVSPREVEETLLNHPNVHETAVVGILDEECGEVIKAFIKKKHNTEVTTDELQDYLSRHLASFKCPAIYKFVNRLPRNNSGKLLKELLK
ncbi:long-chain fatty acid--CoA ligase [bacterium LRH843]|nr:long-chain fatty acid--CoA ligase [bacterium LRH843]